MTTTLQQDPRGATDPKIAQSAKQVAAAAHDGIDRAVEAAHPAVERLSQSAHGAVEKMAGAAASTVESVAARTDQARQVQDELLAECRAYVRDHPMKALGFAVAAGFVLTRIMRD